MNFELSGPSAALSGLVKKYWAINSCQIKVKDHTQRIVPHGLPEIIFYLGDKPKNDQFSSSASSCAFVSGQSSAYYDLKLSGTISIFSILFEPNGLSAFFNLPVSELQNQHVPLNYIFGRRIFDLEEALFDADCFQERVLKAEAFLTGQLENCRKNFEINRISESIKIINSTRGTLSIESLASGACLSRKQYERSFLKFVGTTPKQFLRVVRFQHAIHVKSVSKNLNLTELSYHCGYYDQSHMINDFRALSGLSPKAFFSDSDVRSDYFAQ